MDKDKKQEKKNGTLLDSLSSGRGSVHEKRLKKGDNDGVEKVGENREKEPLSDTSPQREKEEAKQASSNDSKTDSKAERSSFLLEKPENFWESQEQSEHSEDNKNNQVSWFFKIKRKGLFFRWLVLSCLFLFVLAGGRSLFAQTTYIKGKVNGAATESQEYLKNGRQSLEDQNIQSAIENFRKASQEISQAKDFLAKKGQLSSYWSRLPYQSEESRLINLFSITDRTLYNLDSFLAQVNKAAQTSDFSQKRQEEISTTLSQLSLDLKEVESILSKLKGSRYLFPSQISQLRKDVRMLRDQIAMSREVIENLPHFLGYENQQKYLLLFQNNAEMRPTGGFPGTYGYLTISNGKIKDLFLNEIYGPTDKLEEKIDKIQETSLGYPEDVPNELVPKPPILEKYQRSFYSRGVNCSPNFPTVARRAIWGFDNVLEQSSASKVIALDPGVIVDILKITGPIRLPKHDITLDHSNFRSEIERIVEFDNPFKEFEDPDYNPKQVLVDFTPKLMEQISKTTNQEKFKIFFSLVKSLKEKHILLYASEPQLQSLITKYDFGGKVKEVEGDYLQVNLDTYKATKSSILIHQLYNLETEIDREGRIEHDLTVNFKHKGESDLRIHGLNRSWVRVMVPYGSKLIKATWQDKDVTSQAIVFEEAKKQVFLFKDLEIPKQSTKNLKVKYRSSELVGEDNHYQLYFQSQPGLLNTGIKTNFRLPGEANLTNYQPTGLTLTKEGWQYSGDLKQDVEFVLDY